MYGSLQSMKYYATRNEYIITLNYENEVINFRNLHHCLIIFYTSISDSLRY